MAVVVGAALQHTRCRPRPGVRWATHARSARAGGQGEPACVAAARCSTGMSKTIGCSKTCAACPW